MSISGDNEFRFGTRWSELSSGLSIPEAESELLEGRDSNLEHFLSIHTSGSWNDASENSGGSLVPDWVPVVAQPTTALTTTTDYARWKREGNTVTAVFRVAIGSSGAAGNYVNITLPVAVRTTSQAHIIGSGYAYANSTNLYYAGSWRRASATLGALVVHGGNHWFGVNPSIQMQSGSFIEGLLMYEAE
jgi:hypothetical protein